MGISINRATNVVMLSLQGSVSSIEPNGNSTINRAHIFITLAEVEKLLANNNFINDRTGAPGTITIAAFYIA